MELVESGVKEAAGFEVRIADKEWKVEAPEEEEWEEDELEFCDVDSDGEVLQGGNQCLPNALRRLQFDSLTSEITQERFMTGPYSYKSVMSRVENLVFQPVDEAQAEDEGHYIVHLEGDA